MAKNKTSVKINQSKDENRKRRKELAIIFFVSIFLGILVTTEIFVFRLGQNLPSPYIIYFIVLVNVNLILVLFLLFLIFRNVVKIFLEKRSKYYGSSLKSKLTIAFSTFSVIPTSLVLIISVVYLNSSFEKWFSQRMVNVIKNAATVVDSLILQEKKRSFEYGRIIAKKISHKKNITEKDLLVFKNNFQLDAIEFYPQLIADRISVQNQDKLQNRSQTAIPYLNLETLQKSLLFNAEVSYMQPFSSGHLLRTLTPLSGINKGVIVVSKFLDLPASVKINDVTGSYQEFKNNLSIQDPIRSIYFVMLVLLSLVVLFAAVWYGFHLSKQLAVPLVQLGRATKRVAGGDYTPLDIQSGSDEISNLIVNFNQMTANLSASEIELQNTLKNLHQYTKYVEIVLSNVSAGVISVDMEGKITTINNRAKDLLKIQGQDVTGKQVKYLFSEENYKIFSGIIKSMRENKLSWLQKEIKITLADEQIPLLTHVSILKNELQEEIGRILVFDDLTPIVNAQRAAAWSEVARRIAHEIKNPLTPIRLAAERIHRKYGQQISEKAFDDSIQMIVSQVDEMKNLVNEFSQFARMPQLKPAPGQINDNLKQTVEIYKENNPHIRFDIQLDSQMPIFKFDSQQVNRVFMNLVDNAVMALEKELTRATIAVKSEFDSHYQICKITVSDNGMGIPSTERQKVFDPYYSTKEKGTGLGLAIVKSIIEDHSGVIRALPNEPTGTKMYIEIPTKM